ncbi:MAG: ABC transporter permease [Chloroflexota bacterium]|jgi:fluoroquinolone transport system permease protein
MSRLLATMRTDVRLQIRNGFYYVTIFVAVIAVIAFSRLNIPDYRYVWPIFILGNMMMVGFYFMAGMVLLEKGEGTMEAQVITPLRPVEYLLSKVLTLGFLSLVESTILVVLLSGVDFNWLLFLLGLAITAALYSLFGFIAVAPYDSINEFIFPSVLWVLATLPPVLYFLGVSDSWLFFLHPLQAPLVLMQGAFTGVPPWQIIYGILYGALWVGIALYWSLRVFRRFIIRREGTRFA